MPVVRVTKSFTFEMAHALEGYDGPCRQIHGHSYTLFVTVKGNPVADEASPKYGMVMDFGDLKKTVNRLIVERYDHALLLRNTPTDSALFEQMKSRFPKIELVDYQPTCENLVVRFAESLLCELPEGVGLHHLRLHETSASYAEWYADDNR